MEDGPPVAPTMRHGFGTALVKATFPNTRIDYSVEGLLSCEIDVPLSRDKPSRPEAH